MFRYGINQAKNFFFDADRVLVAVSEASRDKMSRAGAFVRQAARSLIGRPAGPKTPPRPAGAPPRGRTDVLRKFIYFAYEPQNDTVVIGPAATNQLFFKGDGRPVKGTVPQVLEEGGEIQRIEVQAKLIRVGRKRNEKGHFVTKRGNRYIVVRTNRWYRRDLRFGNYRFPDGTPHRMKRVRVPPRPFMTTALERERSKAPELFRDSVK